MFWLYCLITNIIRLIVYKGVESVKKKKKTKPHSRSKIVFRSVILCSRVLKHSVKGAEKCVSNLLPFVAILLDGRLAGDQRSLRYRFENTPPRSIVLERSLGLEFTCFVRARIRDSILPSRARSQNDGKVMVVLPKVPQTFST